MNSVMMMQCLVSQFMPPKTKPHITWSFERDHIRPLKEWFQLQDMDLGVTFTGDHSPTKAGAAAASDAAAAVQPGAAASSWMDQMRDRKGRRREGRGGLGGWLTQGEVERTEGT